MDELTMGIVQILSAAGIGGIIGSLLTSIIQAWATNRNYLRSRNFQEKKEAYVGLLEALHQSQIERTPEAAMTVGHWQSRCELVAPERVRRLIARISETNPIDGRIHPDRVKVLADLKAAIREDLGVQL